MSAPCNVVVNVEPLAREASRRAERAPASRALEIIHAIEPTWARPAPTLVRPRAAQFFGQLDIDHRSKRMTVALRDSADREVSHTSSSRAAVTEAPSISRLEGQGVSNAASAAFGSPRALGCRRSRPRSIPPELPNFNSLLDQTGSRQTQACASGSAAELGGAESQNLVARATKLWRREGPRADAVA